MYPDAKSEQLNLGIEELITLEKEEIFFVTCISNQMHQEIVSSLKLEKVL